MASPRPNAQTFDASLPTPDLTDKVIAGTQMASDTIGAIAGLAPVPFLKDAVGLIGHIAQVVKDVKNNQEEFNFIVADCQLFVEQINEVCIRVCESEGQLPGPLVKDLKSFVDSLKKIKVYAEANTHRRRLTRWFYKDLDPESIRRCREELTNRFQAFLVQTSIQTRVDLSVIREHTTKILANLDERRNGHGRTASDTNISQNIADSSAVSPPASSPTSHRPQSAPPTGQLPPFNPVYTTANPFDNPIRHPNFPFHNSPHLPSPQPNFVTTASSSFNSPNSLNVNSGNVTNQVISGENDYSVNTNNYTINGGYGLDSVLGGKLNKANGKVARKLAGRQRRRDWDYDYDSDSDSGRRRRW